MVRLVSAVAVLLLLAGSALAGPQEKGKKASSGDACAMCPEHNAKSGASKASCPFESQKAMGANLNQAKPKCPAGGSYELKTKSDKEHPAAIQVKGKTYYVCTECAKVLKAAKASKSAKPTKATKSAAASKSAK